MQVFFTVQKEKCRIKVEVFYLENKLLGLGHVSLK
jgi:hypothetical protein